MLGAMSSKYGPIITLRALGARYIFLNSSKVAEDLLKKQSPITSNRPHFTVGGELVGYNKATGFLQHGDIHRKHRKLFNQHIGTKKSLVAFYPTVEAEAKQFVCNVLKNPDDLNVHCRRTTMACVFRISHGYSVKHDGDLFQEMTNRAFHIVSTTSAPGFLVDLLPILQYLPEWFPGCGFHKDTKRWRKMVEDAVNMPHEFVLEQLAKGDAEPSFTSRLLQQGLTPEDEEILKWASFTMNLGGSDTTPSMLLAFFRAMTMYPEVQKKAQAEVDSIVRDDRLPAMKDRDALPYVNAICMEILRWNVVIPIAGHVSTKDIHYEGHLIPKGSFLAPNIWFILSNPETYQDPERFDPERFLGEHQQPDPREACFGWGRRVCPGARLAESMLFIYVATTLATLNVSRCVENGVECVPRYEFEEGFLRRIKPFKCRITLRSKKADDLLEG
ncbi:cytochrome P450 [Boletus edulis BED1]|uniref:Cytochrome P450 n=1 Tax=Boletus edulis BED1 TaxID=1328754 RepID=A0AAD4C1C2_BOLED|nr:cytochrome P450 [Boletus edulis BED1]